MANKETNRGKIVELLKTEHFGDPDKPDAGDPVMETMMMLTLDQLVEYDGNPRRAPNAEYDNLKASYIKTGASNTLLVVTKRPGEEFYFPAAGGNTRLRVLRELWDEFRDEKYYRINCKFIPYSDDRKILVDHLNENDNRDGYIFIDRAKTIIGIKEGMDAETEKSPLSERSFVEQLRDMGYSKLSPQAVPKIQNRLGILRTHTPGAGCRHEGTGHTPVARDPGQSQGVPFVRHPRRSRRAEGVRQSLGPGIAGDRQSRWHRPRGPGFAYFQCRRIPGRGAGSGSRQPPDRQPAGAPVEGLADRSPFDVGFPALRYRVQAYRYKSHSAGSRLPVLSGGNRGLCPGKPAFRSRPPRERFPGRSAAGSARSGWCAG